MNSETMTEVRNLHFKKALLVILILVIQVLKKTLKKQGPWTTSTCPGRAVHSRQREEQQQGMTASMCMTCLTNRSSSPLTLLVLILYM